MTTNSIDQKIVVIKGDITRQTTDAIVNAANESLLGGGGVDGAIHRSAGPELLAECKTLGGCPTGEARMTSGYNLAARFIIHTVGPIWRGGEQNEPELLASCYQKSLELVLQNKLQSVSFPSVSTGVYGFPFEKACAIALRVIRLFLQEHGELKKVQLVYFSEQDRQTAEHVFRTSTV